MKKSERILDLLNKRIEVERAQFQTSRFSSLHAVTYEYAARVLGAIADEAVEIINEERP